MIPLILSIAVICFLFDAPEGWHEERSLKSVIKGLGLIIALGVLFLGSCSVLETNPATRSWAFRTGELAPVVHETDNESWQTSVVYRQKSWWRWKTDGEWGTRLNQNGEWEYWDDKKWRSVPLEVYSEAEDDREWEVDNRGWHEQ